MTMLSRIRRLAFVAILVGALIPATVHGDESVCPSQVCESCPAEWSGDCYTPMSGSCSAFGCSWEGLCEMPDGGGFARCYCNPCESE